MSCSYTLHVAHLLLLNLAIKISLCDGTCDPASVRGRKVHGAIESRRNETGGWMTTFWAEKDTEGKHPDINNLNMYVTHRHSECPENKSIKIHGVITELPMETDRELSDDILRFHKRCGTNVRITNNGRSLEKIRIEKWEDGVAFTNRPLKDEELFEVVIDMKGDESKQAIGIGVTTHVPDTIKIPSHMNSMGGTWLMYQVDVYKDGSKINGNYMKNLKELKAGDTIGVKRTASGDLHLFINGVDQGVAASNVPSPVYGVFELYHWVFRVTIVDH